MRRGYNEIIEERRENVKRYGFSIDILESYNIEKDEKVMKITISQEDVLHSVNFSIPPKIVPKVLARVLRQFAYLITHPEKKS